MQKVKNKRKMIIVGLSLFLIILIFLFNFSLTLIDNTSGLSQKIKYLVPQSIRDIYFDEELNKFVLLLGSSLSIAFLELK